MTFNMNWNIDAYKTDYESDEHWQLRRSFMEAHKDKFPEDELVCLAQVFTNVEFMGCKYPDKTMQRVALLSQEVAKNFREERSKRLKRTFVKASDAASARAKGSVAPKEKKPISVKDKYEDDENEDAVGPRVGFGFKRKAFGDAEFLPKIQTPLQKKYKNEGDLLKGLKHGPFVFVPTGDRAGLTLSAVKCGMKVTEKESPVGAQKKIEIFLNDKKVGEAKNEILKVAKAEAYEAAFKKIREECYTIAPNPNADRIHIKKDEKTLQCTFQPVVSAIAIDPNNIGFKMMRKYGWTGGPLGRNNTNIGNAFDSLIMNNKRRGFGSQAEELNTIYFRKMLQDYMKSEDITDLAFETGFTKEERAELHKLATNYKLKSHSYGKLSDRFLVISKKNIPSKTILYEVLINKNPLYMNKYIVTVPACKNDDFPEHKVVF